MTEPTRSNGESRRSKEDELVLVAPTELFRSIGEFQGFLRDDVERYEPLFEPENATFMRRGDAERDPNFKQLIPYVLFVFEKSDGGRSIFAYRRGEGQGEARLRAKWSAGIGGHVNDGDLDDGGIALPSLTSREEPGPFERGAAREIAEEVVLEANAKSFARVGLVNDDSTEVGRVHLGVVCLVVLDAPKLRSNEPDLLEARFRDVDEVLNEIDEDPERYESWTVLALRGGALD